jgi:hypothetical protein
VTDTMEAGDARRLTPIDDTLPVPPEHDDEDIAQIDQPEPQEVPDAVLDL